jgi:hypothetical protein
MILPSDKLSLQVSMDRCRALEAEVATYGALTRIPPPTAAPPDAGTSTGQAPNASSNTGSSSLLAGPATTLTQQVISLQQQVASLKRVKESLTAQVQALEASLRGAQEQVGSTGERCRSSVVLLNACSQCMSNSAVTSNGFWLARACSFAWPPSLMVSYWMS